MHKEFPKSVGRDEFWKQIKRTVNGKEVSEEDISNIVKQITNHILPNKEDHLLDLGCGNGALASNFFPSIGQYTGVDFSEYLLGVAQEFFNPEMSNMLMIVQKILSTIVRVRKFIQKF